MPDAIQHGLGAVRIGGQAPVTAAAYASPLSPWDSGFTIVMADAPEDPSALSREEMLEWSLVVCLHCLIDRYPEAGRGLDLAREHGYASRDPETGEWSAPDTFVS